MYTPDRNIVRKIKEYDPDLYVKYNQKNEYFEVWRKVTNTNVRINQRISDQLITPVTQSIYDQDKPKEFVQLDERIIYWLYASDSHRHGGHKMMWLEDDERFKEFNRKAAIKRWEKTYDKAKDMYNDVNNFYLGSKTNRRGLKKTGPSWLRPDSVGTTSKRLYARTKGNAKAYNYQRKK